MRGYVARSVVLAVALVLIGSLLAAADSVSFQLTSNNLGISGSVGTVTFTDTATNQVTVNVAMSSGFSVKLEGGDIALNGPTGLTLTGVSGFTGTVGTMSLGSLSFMHLRTSQNVSEFGTFDFDFANIKGASGGVVSADTLTFVLTAPGLMANQFTGAGLHFCTASGSDCGENSPTGFASSGSMTPVPEPTTMSLMGAGLIGLAGVVRRRIRR